MSASTFFLLKHHCTVYKYSQNCVSVQLCDTCNVHGTLNRQILVGVSVNILPTVCVS